MVKACDKCQTEFKGWGTTCAACRKTGAGGGAATAASASTACHACGKTVYAMEKLVIDGTLFHKDCFRCKMCNGKLMIGKFSRAPTGEFYCPTHFKELFRLRGRYDEDPTKLGNKADSPRGGPAQNANDSPPVSTKPEPPPPGSAKPEQLPVSAVSVQPTPGAQAGDLASGPPQSASPAAPAAESILEKPQELVSTGPITSATG
ncbi:unnamed protein product [Amoebophrya sp. A120]|nr:unnamed protein product [Amoebophrya sp. A120]|eukprot:GSA120T00024099001.1